MTSHVTFSLQETPVPEQANIVERFSEPANPNEFLKLKVKRIFEKDSVEAGFLLVGSNCIAFCPDVTQSVVVEKNGQDTHIIIPVDDILWVALFKQLHDFSITYYDDKYDCDGRDKNAQHSHGGIFRGESNDNETSTQIPTHTMLPHCLCVKVLSSEAYRTKEFVNRNPTKLTADEIGDKNEHEFWFSIPPWTVDILYKFFVQKTPVKYANFETSEIFADVHAPNVHGNDEIVSREKTVWSATDNPEKLFDENAKLLHVYNETVDRLTRVIEDLRVKIGQLSDQPGTIWYEIAKYQNERLQQLENTKTGIELSRKILNEKAQEATDKRDLMRKRKNKKFNKLNDGVLKAKDVTGFKGQQSIDNILQFIEGGSKNNSKNEKNNARKKTDMKKCSTSNFTDNNVVKSIKKVENESEFSVDGFENYSVEISKKLNLLSLNYDFCDSEHSEHEEYLTDFIPVSRNRLPKNSVNEAKYPTGLKYNFEKQAELRKSENVKQKSNKIKNYSVNPYSWPFILLKPENYEFDEFEIGKIVKHENDKVANFKKFSSSEISEKKNLKNETSSASNESSSKGSVFTGGKNNAPFELKPLSDHCHVLSLRYYEEICEYKKIARKLDLMCNNDLK